MNYNLKFDYMKKELLVIRKLVCYGEYSNCFALITHHALKYIIILIYNNISIFLIKILINIIYNYIVEIILINAKLKYSYCRGTCSGIIKLFNILFNILNLYSLNG